MSLYLCAALTGWLRACVACRTPRVAPWEGLCSNTSRVVDLSPIPAVCVQVCMFSMCSRGLPSASLVSSCRMKIHHAFYVNQCLQNCFCVSCDRRMSLPGHALLRALCQALMEDGWIFPTLPFQWHGFTGFWMPALL